MTTRGRHRIRIFFAFDPRRVAILLIGGDKTDRWDELYDEYIHLADDIYDAHLKDIGQEGSTTESNRKRRRS